MEMTLRTTARIMSSSGLPRRFSRRSTPFSPRHSTACVGGEKGVQFDAIVTGVVESPECPGCVDVPLFHVSSGETAGVEKGEKVRFIVLEDVKGQTVTIFIGSSAAGFEEFLAKGQKVVDSVKWGGS
jgi:hypothetical protein